MGAKIRKFYDLSKQVFRFIYIYFFVSIVLPFRKLFFAFCEYWHTFAA